MKKPPLLTTPEDIAEAAKHLPTLHFTTCDITDHLIDSYPDVSYEQLERSVRASVTWLVDRKMATKVGAIKKITRSGCVSWPETYDILEGRKWNKKEQRVEVVQPDFSTLMAVFVRT